MRIYIFILLIVLSSGIVLAEDSFPPSSSGGFSSSSSVNYQQRASFDRYYSSSDLNTYWPILGDRDSCESRQDILLQILPGGCQPAVVRSDLLGEQNVPVFCQVSALKINPLIDIKSIRNIRFRGSYPKEVVGTGFHPAKAALRTHDQLLGSPYMDNIGYVVVILKKNEKESEIPNFVNFTLSAQLDYDTEGSLGVGRAQFYLKKVSNDEWNVEKLKQSFWQGRYFVRLEEADANFVTVSIYYGDRKISNLRAEKGKPSRTMYVPGMYCQAGIHLEYLGLEAAETKAQIEISNDEGTEIYDVYEGSKIINNRCVVRNIDAGTNGTGNVSLSCKGKEIFLGIRAGLNVSYENGSEIVDLVDKNIEDADGEAYFDKAITTYEGIARDYPSERDRNVSIVGPYGERALAEAVQLAQSNGIYKPETEVRLMNQYIEQYGNEFPERAAYYQRRLNSIYSSDYKFANGVVLLDNRYWSIRLVSVDKPKNMKNVDIRVNGKLHTINESETIPINSGNITIEKVNVENVRIVGKCDVKDSVKTESETIRIGETGKRICDQVIELVNTETEELAIVRLIPEARGTETETNLSVGIGIEKRVIKLTPEKVEGKIEALNASIQKWEGISKNLGNVVKGMKAACFATSGVLTVKTFLEGIDGTALARKHSMEGPEGWSNKCKIAISTGEIDGRSVNYDSMTQCFNKEKNNINDDIAARKEAIETVNERLRDVEKDFDQGDLSSGRSVDTQKATKKYYDYLKDRYKGDSLVDRLPAPDENGTAPYTHVDLRELHYNLELKKKDGANQDAVNYNYNELNKRLDENIQDYNLFKENQKELDDFGIDPISVGRANRYSQSVSGTASQIDSSSGKVRISGKGTLEGINPSDIEGSKHAFFVYGSSYDAKSYGRYAVIGRMDGNKFSPQKVYKYVKKDASTLEASEVSEYTNDPQRFQDDYGIKYFENYEGGKFINPINSADIKVRYFETGPDKGLAQQVPFDIKDGWYAKVNSNLRIGNQIPSYDSSGLPRSWEICNVMSNGVIDESDKCQLVFDANPSAPILGLDEEESRDLVRKSREALMQANNQKGKSIITIFGQPIAQGPPVAPQTTIQCQDFMGVDDCKLLFNVCDPVICPRSRCNLGGDYQVADVIQTGIVGSALLCLPNLQEGVYIPVCLTGIHAGIDAYVSILKSHRDCLQENLESGKVVGICDQIYSVYLCEFFWRQIAPIANILLPKLVEAAYTGNQGARGGGEYLTVMTAWNNAQASVNYFTQVYAVNSIKAFQVRSIEEAGTQFCKSFISVKAPSAFKSLIEPDSPPQFYATFSSIKYSDATVPATAQYKVFYHIFAGNDAGVYYNVYLKSPPDSSYYSTTATIQVESGFIPRGQYASQTRDFTAPEGYKELCVRINNEEECGFGQVSTNFAINQLRDKYASDQITQSDIKSETECISGTRSLGGALVNTNIQTAAEESALPQIYKRGIVRICATDNPGEGTEPSRYKKVGQCDTTQMKCWLDTKSVDNAITDNNIGVKNATLREIEESVGTRGENIEDYRALETESAGILNDLSSKVDSFEESRGEKADLIARAENLIKMIDAKADIDSLDFNHHKAKQLFLKARVYAKVSKEIAASTYKSVVVKVEVKEERYITAGNVITLSADGKTCTVIGVSGFTGKDLPDKPSSYSLRKKSDGTWDDSRFYKDDNRKVLTEPKEFLRELADRCKEEERRQGLYTA